MPCLDASNITDIDNVIIIDAFLKAESVLREHHKACVSISGGADSDIMLDMIERVKNNVSCDVVYVFFDTGLEYRATKEHIRYLEDTYNITIHRQKAKKTIPACVREYGQPFISKYVSSQIERLQEHGFQFENDPIEVLIERYPNCKSAIKWWTNSYANGRSNFDINSKRMLKEFMVDNPPYFKISSKCCTYAKKLVSHEFNDENGTDLMCIGVRKAEGGVRSKNPNLTCFTKNEAGADMYRPLYWFSDSDCAEYRSLFGLRRSDCYEVWGMKRTGCAGCPFNRKIFDDLDLVKQFEPSMEIAARKIFSDSYAYTKAFYEWRHRKQYEAEITSRDTWKRMFDLINESPDWESHL